MQTRCPHCETVFRLTEAQLSAAHGKVRCGLCHSIFTATAFDDEQHTSAELSPPESSSPESSSPELSQHELSQQDETLNDNGYVSEQLAEIITAEDTIKDEINEDKVIEDKINDSDDLLLNDFETRSVMPDEFRRSKVSLN